MHSFLYAALIIYAAFFLKIVFESLPTIFYLRPLSRCLMFIFLGSLFWPKEVIQHGFKKFMLIHFTGIKPWIYEKHKFNKSKQKMVYENSIYFVYRMRSFESDIKQLGVSDYIETLLKQGNMACIVSWLPKIKKFTFMCQHLDENNVTINLENLPYMLDACNPKGFLTMDKCLFEIQKQGIELPHEMILAMQKYELSPMEIKDENTIEYFNSYLFGLNNVEAI